MKIGQIYSSGFKIAKCSLINILLVSFTTSLSSQTPIEIIVHLTSPFPTETGQLVEQYQNYSVTIINNTESPQGIYFLADLVGDNGVSAMVDRNYKPLDPYIIGEREITTLMASDIEALNTGITASDIVYEGISETQLLFGTIPEGNYQLCVNAFEFGTDIQLSYSCSPSFYIGNANVSRIITPFEEEVIPEAEIPIFNISWEYPANDPMQAMNLNYVVKMVDLTSNYDWDIEELFADAGVPVLFETEVEGMTNYLYNNFGDDPPLTYGHEYGIRVQAYDPMVGNSGNNGGYTEIRRFWYGEAGGVFTDTTGVNEEVAAQDTLPTDCEGRCNPVIATNTTPITDLTTVPRVKIGHFVLENPNFTLSGNKFSGDAEITLSFLSDIKIKVTAQNLMINNEGIVYSGTVKSQLAQEETIQGLAQYLGIPDQANPALDYIPENIVSDISNVLEFVRTVDALVGSNAVGLPLGFPVALKGNELYTGITDIRLTPEGGIAKVMMSAKMAMFDGENPLLLTGDSVCIHPEGFGGSYQFGLQSDLNLPNDGNNAFEFFLTGAGTSPDNYCSVEMGCDGIEALNIYGHMFFPRSILTPVVADMNNIPPDLKVRANFGFTLDNNNATAEDSTSQTSHVNWLGLVTMDKFEIKGLKGWQFDITEAYIDMSDLTNAPNVIFPPDYHTTTADFRGFYMKEASLTPPGHLLLDSTSVVVRDLLIDPAIYGRLEVSQVLPIEKGNLAGYGFGIDSLILHFYDNSLMEGRMTGPLQIPITDITDSLYYTALIEDTALPEDEASYMYVFDITLQDTVGFPFLIGNGQLFDDSYLDIAFFPENDNEVYVQTFLHGVLNIDTERFYPDNLPDLPAEAKLFDMEYQLDYTSGVGFDSDNTMIGFASPQKGLGGFPINLDNFGVSLAGGTNTVAVQFNVDISFAKGELDLGAGVTFTLVSNLEPVDALGDIANGGAGGILNTIKTLRLERIQFDSILIDVDKGSFGFNGMVCFYNNPLEGGGRDKGVRGQVTVQIPVATVGLEVIFGNIGTPPDLPPGAPMQYSEDFYTYWYVRGIVILASGIPICSGVGIYGLGGGVGYNVIQTSSSSIVDGEVVGQPVYTPTYNSFRLEFTVVLGTMPKADAFNADVTFIAQFVNGGLDMIGIEGDGYIMTPINERMDPQVYVGVGIYLYAQNEERDWFIDGYLRVAVNVAEGKFRGTIEHPEIDNLMVDAAFYVDAQQWYFHAGEPDMNPYDNIDPRGSAEFQINDNLVARFKAYMMVGHGIPTTLPPLPPDIQRILNNPSGEMENTEGVGTISADVGGNAAETASGFAHGSYGELTAEIDAKIIYASLNVYVGYDMNLTQRPYNCANTGNRIGINGWYAEGQAYAGIEGNLGVQIKLFGDEPERFHLMSVAAAIALRGGAPAPAYFGGQASVYYSVLGGKIDGYETFSFSVGERCAISPNDPLAGINFYESVDPTDGEQDVPPYARVLTKFTLPMDETIYVPVPVLDANGEVINVEELGYTPRISYTLRRKNSTTPLSIQGNHWVDPDYHDLLRIRPTAMMEENKNYVCTLSVKAIEESTGSWLRVDGQVWSQDTIIEFRTGPYPDDLYDLVKYGVPMPYERYYLQDENTKGKIYFTQSLPQNHYFPTSNPGGFGTISYYIKLTNLHNQVSTEIPFINNSGTPFGPNLEFNLPDLENETIYAIQVIRKNTGKLALPTGNTGQITVINDENAEMTINTTIFPPGEILARNEFLLYHSYFRTSKYDNFAQKINASSTSNSSQYGSHQTFGKKLTVLLSLQEKFETRDFRTFTPQSEYTSDLIFQPRAKVTDIFSTTYHNLAEDKIFGLKQYYEDNVFMNYPFYAPFPNNLKIEWDQNTSYIIPSSNVNGPFDPPLSESEVASLWGNYQQSGNFVYSPPSQTVTVNGFGGQTATLSIQTPPLYNIKYDTHFRVCQDKKTIIDWANNYLASTFYPMGSLQYLMQNQYPQFIAKKNSLASTNLKLQNNNGNYKLYFNRNNAHNPNSELWSWFLGNIDFTSTAPVQAFTTIGTLNNGMFSNSSSSSGNNNQLAFSNGGTAIFQW